MRGRLIKHITPCPLRLTNPNTGIQYYCAKVSRDKKIIYFNNDGLIKIKNNLKFNHIDLGVIEIGRGLALSDKLTYILERHLPSHIINACQMFIWKDAICNMVAIEVQINKDTKCFDYVLNKLKMIGWVK